MTGVATLVRHHLRRDRWMIFWWCVGGTVLYWSQAVSVAGLYATQAAEFDKAAKAMDDNAAFIAMAGPARALDTVGGQVAWQATAFGAVVAGLMSMFLIGRHSRAEEEAGRDDLVRSTAIGRRAPLTSALIVALLANLLLGLMVAFSLISVRQGDTSLDELRAIGDVGNPALSWLSPIGWYQAMHAFWGLRWWPVLIMILAAGAAVVAAYGLFGRRDVGAGLLAARPGPAEAGAGLRSGLGLAWRLQRGAVYGWAAGHFLTGLSYGSIGDSVEDLVGDSDFAEAFGAGVTDNLVDGFYATAIVQLALIACGFAISSTLRPRTEEEAGHSEVLLATGLSRRAWLGGHVLVTPTPYSAMRGRFSLTWHPSWPSAPWPGCSTACGRAGWCWHGCHSCSQSWF